MPDGGFVAPKEDVVEEKQGFVAPASDVSDEPIKKKAVSQTPVSGSEQPTTDPTVTSASSLPSASPSGGIEQYSKNPNIKPLVQGASPFIKEQPLTPKEQYDIGGADYYKNLKSEIKSLENAGKEAANTEVKVSTTGGKDILPQDNSKIIQKKKELAEIEPLHEFSLAKAAVDKAKIQAENAPKEGDDALRPDGTPLDSRKVSNIDVELNYIAQTSPAKALELSSQLKQGKASDLEKSELEAAGLSKVIAVTGEELGAMERDKQASITAYQETQKQLEQIDELSKVQELTPEQTKSAQDIYAVNQEAKAQIAPLLDKIDEYQSLRKEYDSGAATHSARFEAAANAKRQALTDKVYRSKNPFGQLLYNAGNVIEGGAGSVLSGIAGLPRTIAPLFTSPEKQFEYDWTESLANSATRMTESFMLEEPTKLQREAFEDVAKIGDYEVVVKGGKVQSVRDSEGYTVKDPAIVKTVSEQYKTEQPKVEMKGNVGAGAYGAFKALADMGMTLIPVAGVTGRALKGLGMAEGAADFAGIYAGSMLLVNKHAYEAGIEAGLSPQLASLYANGVAGIEAVSESINPMEAQIARRMLGGATRMGAKEFAQTYISGVGLKSSLKKGLGVVTKNFAAEGGEGVTAQKLGNIQDVTYNKLAASNFDTEETLNDYLSSFTLEGATGLFMSPLSMNAKSQVEKEALALVIQDTPAAIENINKMIGKGVMRPDGKVTPLTQEEAVKITTELQAISDRVKSIKDVSELDEEKSIVATDLVRRKMALEEKLKGENIDDIAQKKYKDGITAINNQLEILTGLKRGEPYIEVDGEVLDEKEFKEKIKDEQFLARFEQGSHDVTIENSPELVEDFQKAQQSKRDEVIISLRKQGILVEETEPISDIPESVQLSLDRIEQGKPTDPIQVKEASDYLYVEYKRLAALKNDNTRTFTTDQINSAMDDLEAAITELESHKLKQNENNISEKTLKVSAPSSPTVELSPTITPDKAVAANEDADIAELESELLALKGETKDGVSSQAEGESKLKEEGQFVVQGTFNGHQVIAGDKKFEVSDQRQIGQSGETKVVETKKDGKKIFTLVSPRDDNFGRSGYLGVSLVLPENTTKTSEQIREILDNKQKEVLSNIKDGKINAENVGLEYKESKLKSETQAPVIAEESETAVIEADKEVAGKNADVRQQDNTGNNAAPAQNTAQSKAEKEGIVFSSEKELDDYIASESENELELAETYIRSAQVKNEKSYKDQQIEDYGIKMTEEHFGKWGDVNNINQGIAKSHIRKDAPPLDTQLLELSEIAGVEITEQDVMDYIERKDKGRFAAKETPLKTKLKDRYRELFGKELDPKQARKIIQTEINKQIQNYETYLTTEAATVAEAEQQYYEAIKRGDIPFTDAEGISVTERNPQGEQGKGAEVKKDIGEQEQAKAPTDKEIALAELEKARAEFRKAMGGLSTGGLQALEAFTNLIKAYIKAGYVTAKEVIDEFRKDYPKAQITDEQIQNEFNKINEEKTPTQDTPPTSNINEPVEGENKGGVSDTEVGDGVGGKKKTVATVRAYEGTFREDVKRKLEKMGLNRFQISFKEAEEAAVKIINEWGLDTAIKMVKAGDVRGGAATEVLAAKVLDIDAKMNVETDPVKLDKLADEYAIALNELDDISGVDAGQKSAQLYHIYQKTGLGWNVQAKIDQWKEQNNGYIPAEVEARFRENDRKIKELTTQISKLQEEAEKAKAKEGIENIQESIEREKKKGSNEKRVKEASKKLADKFRKAKLSRPDVFSSATPASLVWDAAMETVATTIEASGSVAQAVIDGLKVIKESDWYKGLNDETKEQAEQAFTEFAAKQQDKTDGKIKIPHSMIRDFVERGINTIEELTLAIQDAIKEEYPDATEREVRDAITNYGKTIKTKGGIEADIRKMKRLGKLISQLEDIRAKKRPLRSGQQRDKLEADERAKMKEVREAMKELPADEELEAEQLKTATDATKQRLKNQIEDLQREIDKGEQVPKTTRSIQEDAELKELREKRDKIKAEHDALFKDEEFKEAKRLETTKKNAQRRIEDLQRKIREKDFTKKVRKPLIADTELTRLRAEKMRLQEEYDKELYKNKLENRTNAEVIIDALGDAWGLTRALRATGEWSFMLVQGGIQTIAHPVNAAQAFRNSYRFFASPAKTQAFLDNIKGQEWYHELKTSKLAITEPHGQLTAREELFYSDWFNAIWNFIGSPFKLISEKAFNNWKMASPLAAFERAAVGYLDTLRVLRFLQGKQMLEAKGITFAENPKAYKEMADVINTFTGRASLGSLEQQSEKLSKIFFSPRNWASVIKQTILLPRQLVKWQKTDEGGGVSVANKMAIRDLSTMVGVTLGFVMLAALHYNNDDDDETGVEFDPRSSDFMKIKLGNKRVDAWGGKIQQIIFFMRMLAEAVHYVKPELSKGGFKTASGDVVPLGTPYKAPTAQALAINMAINKLSPSAALMQNFMNKLPQEDGTYTDDYGNPYTLKQDVKDNMYPMYISTVGDLLKDDPKALDGILMGYAFFGGGVNIYDKKPKKQPFISKDKDVNTILQNIEIKPYSDKTGYNDKGEKVTLTPEQVDAINKRRNELLEIGIKKDISVIKKSSDYDIKNKIDKIKSDASKLAKIEILGDNLNNEKIDIRAIAESKLTPGQKLQDKEAQELKIQKYISEYTKEKDKEIKDLKKEFGIAK